MSLKCCCWLKTAFEFLHFVCVADKKISPINPVSMDITQNTMGRCTKYYRKALKESCDASYIFFKQTMCNYFELEIRFCGNENVGIKHIC